MNQIMLDLEETLNIPKEIEKKFNSNFSLAELLCLKKRTGSLNLKFYTDTSGSLGSIVVDISSVIFLNNGINFLLKGIEKIYFFNLKFQNKKDTHGVFFIRKIER